MRGDDDGASTEPRFNRRSEARHRRWVERRSGFVEQQDGSRTEEGTGQRHALALPGAQGETLVSDRRREAGRQVRHQVGEANGFEHPAQLFLGRVRRAQSEVLGQRRIEEVGALGQP